jgi:hypothetical protein
MSLQESLGLRRFLSGHSLGKVRVIVDLAQGGRENQADAPPHQLLESDLGAFPRVTPEQFAVSHLHS